MLENDVPDSSQISASVVNGEENRRSADQGAGNGLCVGRYSGTDSDASAGEDLSQTGTGRIGR